MVPRIFDKRQRREKKGVEKKREFASPVKIMQGHREVSLGTLKRASPELATHGELSSRKPLTLGGNYELVCRSKKFETSWDVVITKAIKENHIDSKYNVDIVNTCRHNL